MDKGKLPTQKDLLAALGKSYRFWKEITEMVNIKYPGAFSEWNYPGPKYGWSFRMKDKKRVIIYLLPRAKTFMAAFVFGQKAVETIMSSEISEAIQPGLKSSKVYGEGRGIRIEVKSESVLKDIGLLIDIKLAF